MKQDEKSKGRFEGDRKKSKELEAEVAETLDPSKKRERDRRNELDGFPQDAKTETPDSNDQD